MKRLLLAISIALIIAPACAQEFTPPDEQLWRTMGDAFAKLSMPLDAHQQIVQIMRQVEAEAVRKKIAAAQANASPVMQKSEDKK